LLSIKSASFARPSDLDLMRGQEKTNPQPQLDTQVIRLNRLKKSPRNSRTVPHTSEEIAAHGLLQDPVLEPEP
jgi:hypothetical protein